MEAGKLRHHVTIESNTTERVGLDDIETPFTYAERMVCLEPLSGREYERAKAYAATVSHKILMRYLKGLRPDMRVVLDDGRVLQINYVLDWQERHREQICYCTELVEEYRHFYDEAGAGGIEAGGEGG